METRRRLQVTDVVHENAEINRTVKVAGVTFENRQKYLQGLAKTKKPVEIRLIREPANPTDKNAIKVLAVTEKGRCPVGYIPREDAAVLAPVMDEKHYIHVDGFEITGGYGGIYGMRLALRYYVPLRTKYRTATAETSAV